MDKNQVNHNNPDSECDQENLVGHGKHEKVICHTETCENITIAVPVEVSAHADIGNIVLKCMGSRIIERDKPKKVMKFEIVQDIFAKIPIEFIAEVKLDDECVDFELCACGH